MVARGTDDIKHDTAIWMALAHRVALQAKEAGIGEAMGAMIVQRSEYGTELVGLAGDARYHQGALLAEQASSFFLDYAENRKKLPSLPSRGSSC
ncbi:hypothetical protein THARTR1_11213 [Trichoderma harzianum]|uniref:CMP/dCMP-type deaminase domain-containing protein n=1 Tax=Trichoderma harzianum TaxID=5544 RepID=A0A2K0T934_TRIHA|nr:hypothetical protein THARTR1_11213 [Trichoderma harzianum]